MTSTPTYYCWGTTTSSLRWTNNSTVILAKLVNLDNKHWQGGSTTVLEERDLPVVFQDIVGRSVSPGSTTSSTSSSTGTRASARRPGRKSAATNRQEEEEFSPEEAERLKIRRERNKEAAARCRKRKLDQIETLEKQ